MFNKDKLVGMPYIESQSMEKVGGDASQCPRQDMHLWHGSPSTAKSRSTT